MGQGGERMSTETRDQEEIIDGLVERVVERAVFGSRREFVKLVYKEY